MRLGSIGVAGVVYLTGRLVGERRVAVGQGNGLLLLARSIPGNRLYLVFWNRNRSDWRGNRPRLGKPISILGRWLVEPWMLCGHAMAWLDNDSSTPRVISSLSS